MAGPVTLIKRYMKKYSDTTKLARQIQTFIREETEDIQILIDAEEEKIEESQRNIEHLRTQCMERVPKAFTDLDDANREIKKLENSIKKLGHDMDPTDLVKKGVKLNEHGISVTISKVTHTTRYKPALLQTHPELLDVVLDGDPLVLRTVDSDILERLVEQGDFPREEAEKYREIIKTKNPSVSIKESRDE